MAKRISGSVGKGGKNKPDDVKAIQQLLNQHKSAGGFGKLPEDGNADKKFFAAIEAFQKKVLCIKADGLVDANSKTLEGLNNKAGFKPTPEPEPKGAGGGGGGDDDDDGDDGDLFDVEGLRKCIRKLIKAEHRFAFAVASKPEDCKLVLKRKGNPKVLAQIVKKKTELPKVTFGMAGPDKDDKQTLVLNIMGKQLPGMAKKGKQLLKINKLMPYKKVKLMIDGQEVEDLPDDEGEAVARPEGGAGEPARYAMGEDSGPIPDAVKAKIARTPQVWNATRRSVAANIGQLKGAVRKAFASEGRDILAGIDKDMRTLDGVLTKLDDRLAKSLEKAANAGRPAEFHTEIKNAKAILAGYIKTIGSDPIIAHIDANPFGVKTELRKTLTTSLTGIAQAMSVRGMPN
jgi:hypothetical protein